jgi:hypothetical protein
MRNLAFLDQKTYRILENRVRRRIFRPRRKGLARDRRKVHNEELHNLYFSSNVLRIVKSSGIKFTDHAPRVAKI